LRVEKTSLFAETAAVVNGEGRFASVAFAERRGVEETSAASRQ
jgi:hypothetical protein